MQLTFSYQKKPFDQFSYYQLMIRKYFLLEMNQELADAGFFFLLHYSQLKDDKVKRNQKRVISFRASGKRYRVLQF
jgi:hypothetical protein